MLLRRADRLEHLQQNLQFRLRMPLQQSDSYTNDTRTGTAIGEPIRPANAYWEATPQMLMQTAIASS